MKITKQAYFQKGNKIVPKQNMVNIGKSARVVLTSGNPYPKVLKKLIALADRRNRVHLGGMLKDNILGELGMKKDSSFIRLSLYRYIKLNYMVKLGDDCYFINPEVAFKCSNSEFHQLMQEYDFALKTVQANKKRGKTTSVKPLGKTFTPKLVEINSK